MRLLYILLFISFLPAAPAGAASTYFKFLGSTVQLADSADAAATLSKPDAYSASHSTFDMQGRFQDQAQHSQKDYLQYAAKQVSTWPASDMETIKAGFEALARYAEANNLKLPMPDTIVFIRSTCKEEFGAGGYTRGDAIVINKEEGIVNSLIAHELFHVISRKSPVLRDKIYADIGFKKCNPIDMNAAIGELNITNPDCPVIEHYITIGGEDMVLVLHSTKPYTGGNVFEKYINVSLMPVTGAGANKKPVMKDGKPVLYDIQEQPELFEVIGTNTSYILHPEEVCAENFASLMTERKVRQPEYLEKMKAHLQAN